MLVTMASGDTFNCPCLQMQCYVHPLKEVRRNNIVSVMVISQLQQWQAGKIVSLWDEVRSEEMDTEDRNSNNIKASVS